MTATHPAAPDHHAAHPPADHHAPHLAPDPAAAHPAPHPDAGLRREWQAPFGVDVRLTLSPHRRGGRDPAYRVDQAGAVWRTSLTPDGPGTLRVTSRGSDNTLVIGQAWGPGAVWLLDTLPAQLGAHDDLSGFTAHHAIVGELALRHPGLRVGRTGRLFEALVPAVLEQKVVGVEAHRAWRILLGKFGTPAPGPAPPGMRVVPPPRVWARIPSWDWHRAGVEGVRARTIITAADVASRLEQALEHDLGLGPGPGPGLGLDLDPDPAETDRRLRSLPGIGPWTSAEIRQRAAGDADAVSVGDYHLPKTVGWTLARQITDDAGMLELLAPYAGHRYRVSRLIELGGTAPPRRGPRMSVRDYRAI
ncbi:MAG TPA: DNA-3-methyladenine glycosylase 2 family protein [Streptosporangiaceae bacterium]|nr:DNA-3-methyladenine glycosylase 2 family protein [Streptosporangiaceae bacterium]